MHTNFCIILIDRSTAMHIFATHVALRKGCFLCIFTCRSKYATNATCVANMCIAIERSIRIIQKLACIVLILCDYCTSFRNLNFTSRLADIKLYTRWPWKWPWEKKNRNRNFSKVKIHYLACKKVFTIEIEDIF